MISTIGNCEVNPFQGAHGLVKSRVCLIAFAMFLVMLLAGQTSWAQSKVFRIGIIQDGDYHSYRPFLLSIQSELQQLTQNDLRVTYPEAWSFNAEFDVEVLQQRIAEMNQTNQIDLILSLGPEAGKQLNRLKDLSKPVVAVGVDFPTALGLIDPRNHQSTNPLWVTSYDPTIELRVAQLVTELAKIQDFAYVCSRHLCDNNSQAGQQLEESQNKHPIRQYVRNIGRMTQIPASVIQISPDNFQARLQGIQQDTVFVGNLYQFSDSQRETLFKLLSDQGIKAFTEEGLTGAMSGALAATHEWRFKLVGRLFALKIFDIANGIPPREISVVDNWEIQMVFNRETIRKVDFDVPNEMVFNAKFVGEEAPKETLTLEQSIQTAVQRAYDLKEAMEAISQSRIQTEALWSGYYPQVNLNLTHASLDHTRADLSPSPRNQTRVGLDLAQNLYNRELNQSIDASKKGTEQAEVNRDLVELELRAEVTNAYLQVLMTRAILNIRLQHVRTYQKLLNVAQVRYQMQAGSKSDVLRLEIQLENARVAFTNAVNDEFQARVSFNNLLNRPLESDMELLDQRFSSQEFENAYPIFNKFFTSSKRLQTMRNYLTQKTLKESYELKALKLSLAQLNLEKRRIEAKYYPTLSAGASWFRMIQDEHRDFETSAFVDQEENYEDGNRTGWNLQLQLSYPLYQGGSRAHELQVIQSQLRSKQLEIDQTTDNLSTRARTLHYELFSSRQETIANIRNVKRAKETLNLGEISYLQGDMAVTDLLDIQSDVILSEISATLVRYQFFFNIMQMFRNVGIMEVIGTPEYETRYQQLIDEMNAYFKQHYQDGQSF